MFPQFWIPLHWKKKINHYPERSTKRTSNNTEYTRKYVHEVAEGDAFRRSRRSLANA